MHESPPKAPVPPLELERSGLARISPWTVTVCAALLGGLWLLDLFVLKTRLLASHAGHAALVPLYAFFEPHVVLRALGFVALAFGFVARANRMADPKRVSSKGFVALLFVAGLVLPFALFLVRQDPGELGREFVYYQNDEFYFDARRVISLADFLKYYVELMPQLSLHGQHFPPGHATLLYLVSRIFGEGTLPAGLACLVCFALAIVFAYFALVRSTRESEDGPGASRARQGALLLLAAPSMLDFACTSMDAVFLLFATIAWWVSVKALGPSGRARDAIATGAALFVATFFSFSALPVGLAVGLAGAFGGRQQPSRTITRLAWVGASYVACAALCYLVTGFSISACLSAARSGAHELMDRAAGRTVGELWPEISFGNALAFLLGAGIALVSAVAASFASARHTLGRRASDAWSRATLVALAFMSCAGIYFLETERIWMFALPWLAAIAVSERAFAPSTLRLLLAVGLAQAWLMEVLLFTLW